MLTSATIIIIVVHKDVVSVCLWGMIGRVDMVLGLCSQS